MPFGPDQPITVVMNAASGHHDSSAVRAEIEAVLREGARDVEVRVARRAGELDTLARQAAATRGGILAAAGGDGTLNAVAAVAHAFGLPLGLIPLGTFNYFGREHAIPLEPAAAARVILEGCVRPVTVGQVNGRLFLNNASIGLYRRVLERRELHKRRFGRNRVVAAFSALTMLLSPHRAYRLRLTLDGETLTWNSPSVFFGRNALQLQQLGLDEAECVARGELAVLGLREVGRGELLELLLRGALGRLETTANLHQHCAGAVVLDRLDGHARRIRVAVDGEFVDSVLPLRVEAVRDGLQLIVPRASGGEP